MLKRITLLVLSVMLMNTVTAQSQKKTVRNKIDNNIVDSRINLDRGGLIETVILTEDFSNFTEGSEENPDDLRLDNIITTDIDDAYFNSPGWSGIEIYQAGGCAYIGFSDEYGEPGLISTPLINTEGAIYIKCRMRSENPAGEIVGYNIVDEYYDAIDSNVDFIEITDEWTDVSWFTTSGAEDTYIYIFSYSSNVFIDDIEIVSCSMPVPVILEETNIGRNAFTANWETVENSDEYIFQLIAEHTAATNETFYYTDTDFSNVKSEGTISSPETVESKEKNINGWHIYMPILINEAIGMTGRYSSIEQFGVMTSPVLDLSSDKGNVSLSFKAYGEINDMLEINLITPKYGYYDIASSKTVTIESEGWSDYSVTLTDGIEDSYIELTYFGASDIFIDDLKLYQTINEGETKTLTLVYTETQDTHHRAVIDDRHVNDILYYQVASSKLVFAQDGEKEIGAINSDFSEVRYIKLDDTPQEAETMTIGNGDLNSYYAPVSNYGGSSNFSISQQIYTKEEINKENGLITNISFHNNYGNSNTRNIVVYISNTEKEMYDDNHDWIAIDDSQIVFAGDFTFAAQGEWSTIEFDTPFSYTGNNIAVTIYDKTDLSIGYSGYDSFYASPTETWRGLYKTSTAKIDCAYLNEVYGYELRTSLYVTPPHQFYVNNIKINVEPMTFTIPAVPQNVSAKTVDEASISLTWTNAQNATSYNVYLESEKIANVTETSYLAEGLNANTQYCFTITSVNGETESDASTEVCAKTDEPAPLAPAIPTNLNANAKSTSSIELTWEISENATSYNIYRDNQKIANATTTSYLDENLEYDTKYCYAVTSVNEDLESEKSDEVCVKTLGESLAEMSSSLEIYPNPVENRILITTDANIEEISIYTMTGVLAKQQTNTNGQQIISVDVDKLSSGVYFVKVITDNGEAVKRFVKK